MRKIGRILVRSFGGLTLFAQTIYFPTDGCVATMSSYFNSFGYLSSAYGLEYWQWLLL